MGESKRKKNSISSSLRRLEEMFQLHGVKTSEFGFYDQPVFLGQEAVDSDYVSNYAKWVMFRTLSKAYKSHAQSIVPKLTELISNALAEDHWEGSCVVASALITRMLDRLKVWSFGIVGSATFSVRRPPLWRGLHTVDHKDLPGAALGHAWVCAPPFVIVDASAKLQRWGNDPIRAYIPGIILDENGYRTRPKVEDVVSSTIRHEYAIREGRVYPNLHRRLEPGLHGFSRIFPCTQATIGPLAIKYIPTAIGQSDVPLEEINSAGEIGRTGRELWEQIVRPAFVLN